MNAFDLSHLTVERSWATNVLPAVDSSLFGENVYFYWINELTASQGKLLLFSNNSNFRDFKHFHCRHFHRTQLFE